MQLLGFFKKKFFWTYTPNHVLKIILKQYSEPEKANQDKQFPVKSNYQPTEHLPSESNGYNGLHVGGRDKALAMSTMLTMTVFIPFPLPSTCKTNVKQKTITEQARQTPNPVSSICIFKF